MKAKDLVLVGDIGGTHARFALVERGSAALMHARTLKCHDYPGPQAAIRDYLAGVRAPMVSEACFAVAAPVVGNTVAMTNNHWMFDIEDLRNAFGWRWFRLVNDYTAMALGVLHVPQDKLVSVGGPAERQHGPLLIMGPGTGLGVSALVPSRQGWVPLSTEGGHVDFAPTDEVEDQILNQLRPEFGRVSAERLLCGEGLMNLYRVLAIIKDLPATLATPEQVTDAALTDSNELAQETLQRFCRILGRVAGNAALTLGSFGGVYLCGGILPAILPFFLSSAFRDEFENKGRMRSLLASTPVWVVQDPLTGLYGAAAALSQGEAR
ncbi:glucokinase [Marinobacter halophilus]|uniref:Glucokinase n=1 Tax=Marinobacter halophilus TaxID=1323740 RepID=A0A2T1K935_9GAMM|nr:glucokinase [Marinobacter halophilus]PSF06627.1 glucokinase [Marinobacter halophilus]GGC74230.1 glucokinase [Marinobacter halophilus]